MTISDKIFYIIFIHLFVYIFLYFNFFEKSKIKLQFVKKDFILLVTSVIMILGNSYYVINNLDALGGIYLINFLIFISIAFIPKMIQEGENNHKVKSLIIVIAASFLAFTIPAVLGDHLIGISWGLEALLIIYISFLFNLSDLKPKGYFLFVIATIAISRSTFIFIDYNFNLNYKLLFQLIYDWVSLFSLLFILGQIIKKFNKYKIQKDESIKEHITTVIEDYIVKVINESLGILALLLFYIPLFYYIKEESLIFSIIPMFGLLFWGIKKELFISIYLGYSLFISLFIAIGTSMSMVNSYHFGDQLLLGKVAIIEMAIILFFLQSLLIKLKYDGFLLIIAKLMRTIFLLILPFVIISPVKRHFYEYLLFAFWGSIVINYIIYEITKRKSSKRELVLLINIVSLISFISILDKAYFHFNFHFYYSNIVAILGFVILFTIFIMKKGYDSKYFNNPDYSIFFTLLIYYTASYIFVKSFYFYKTITLSLILSLLFLSTLILLRSKVHIIKNTLVKTYILIEILLSIFYMMLLSRDSVNINRISLLITLVVIIIFYILLYTKKGFYKEEKDLDTFIRKLNIHIFHIFVFGFYFLLVLFFIGINLGIVLTISIMIHGIWIIFTSLKKEFKFLTKLSILLFIIGLSKLFFLDLSNSSIVQKMIVFIVLGVVLLFSAFVYQKVKVKLKNYDKDKGL